MVLATQGPQLSVDVSTELGVNPSTGTRMCDRLVRKGVIRRSRTAGDRRGVRLTLTPAGRTLVGGGAQPPRRRVDESGLRDSVRPARRFGRGAAGPFQRSGG